MTVDQKVTMKFRGQKYNFKQVLSIARLSSTPQVTITVSELFPIDTLSLSLLNATTYTVDSIKDVIPLFTSTEIKETIDVENMDIIFFKFDNKYIILSGREKAKEMLLKTNTITGKLLTSVALKQCKEVDPSQLQEPVVNSTPARYGDDFKNRPRFQERNTDRRSSDRRRV
jgi:hypothetical protein